MSHHRLPLTESQYPTIPKILEYLIFLVHSYPLNGQAFFKEGLMNNSSICAIISMVEFCITGSLSFKIKDREDLHSLFWVSHFDYCNPITRALLLWQSKNKTKHTKYTITHATIFSESNLETSRVTPTHRAKKKKNPHWNKNVEIHSYPIPHSQHSTTQFRRNPQLPASSWEAGALDHTSSSPNFKAHIWLMGPPKDLALKANGAVLMSAIGL